MRQAIEFGGANSPQRKLVEQVKNIHTWLGCLLVIQALEIRCSCRRKDVSSQPAVVEVWVGGQANAPPLRLSGKARTVAAAIFQVVARIIAGQRQNHGSYRGEMGVARSRNRLVCGALEGGGEAARRDERSALAPSECTSKYRFGRKYRRVVVCDGRRRSRCRWRGR